MATEDLTTYVETDPESKLTVTAPKVAAAGMTRQSDTYVYKDFGASHFDALDIDFELKITSGDVSWQGAALTLANAVDDLTGLPAYSPSVLLGIAAGPIYRVYLLAVGVGADYCAVSAGTTYYCTLSRSAGNDTIALYLYTDSGRTVLYDTLLFSGFGTSKFRYLYAVCSFNSGSSLTGSFYINDIDLNEGSAPVPVWSSVGRGVCGGVLNGVV